MDTSVPNAAPPPKIYRAMKKNPSDNLPVVGSGSSSELGVRPGVDIPVDDSGNVVPFADGEAKGMSIAPSWRKLEFTRIPKRLRSIVPGATGANSTSCYVMGAGPFQRGPMANGLELVPDNVPQPTHGVIAPTQAVSLDAYRKNLEMTRNDWVIDEA